MKRVPRGFEGIIRAALFLMGACSLWHGCVEAQEFRSTLRVEVRDSSGAAIAAAQVVLADKDSGLRIAQNADSAGEIQLQGILPGTYALTVTAAGFAAHTQSVVVAISAHAAVRAVLTPETLQQSVEVKDRGPSLASQPIETSSSTVQTVITANDIDEVPLSARSFANIALMAPFTAPVEPSDPTKARITAVSFGGSSGLNIDFSVDGGDNNDDFIGGFLQNYSPEAMQEFVVRSAQFGADTSRTNGGSIILSTRRGANDWHGSASYYYRGKNLNARNPLDNPEPDPKQPFARQNGIATLGGPLKRDKLWFFSSYEYVDENASVAYSGASQDEFQALAQLASDGLIPGVPSIAVPTNVPVPFRDTLFTTRVDWAQSDWWQWFLRGSLDRNRTQNDLVQQAALPSTGSTTTSNYYNILLGQQWRFAPGWLGALTLEASNFHHTKERNSELGLALAFPLSANFLTTSGFETFGDNQFATVISAFPVERDQQKYQLKYDVSRSFGRHGVRFGVNVIHEPVLRGALAASAEHLVQFTQDPTFYLANTAQFVADYNCTAAALQDTTCTDTDAGDGTFAQSLRRLGFYAEDSWRVTPSLTVNAGLRYDTTFGLFEASGRDQTQNPAFSTLQALSVPLVNGIPHDYRKAFAPRLGLAFSPGGSQRTVLRAGVGLYYNDLAQNGWVDAFAAVNQAITPCLTHDVANPGCLPSGEDGGQGAVIDPRYHTPYALQASAAVEHDFAKDWRLSVTYEHQQGNHQYRRYEYIAGFSLPADSPNISLFRGDNRSSYNGLAVQLQHRFSNRFELTANYVLASATTWGAVVGELFDYVNGVSNPLNAFGPGDHGPSGEDIRRRFVLIGTLQLPWRFELSTLSQFESARPFTIGTPADVLNDGFSGNDRAVVNGVQTSLDQFRGTPFYQVDLRVSRNIALGERVTLRPFAEFFNLFNRQNPGNNYVGDVSALPTPVNDLTNATAFCLDGPACTQTAPITSYKQLRVPAGALGDFFGPGTTVGIPFAAQLGLKLTF
ncbi:MAG TPA: carboxypeptidase regulatory-like domain-containing protein [Candidatus Acidoferrum sp.]|nr:carboxypeptidase regulatory-like domain-containing protein [Candidatus Acidoferrum sp.]